MNLTNEQAVSIYAAARTALHQAAREKATLTLTEISATTVDVLAAAGRAAFEESLKIASQQEHLFSILVTRSGNGTEYILGGQPLKAPALGLILADIVRHGSKALKIKEEDAWDWMERERDHPTSSHSEVTRYAN